LYAWGREPGASLGDAHGGRPWVGEVMRWHFCQRHDPRNGNGAVRGAIRNIAAKPDYMTQRRWISFADTRQITISKQSARISGSGILSRQCVGGDGHPVGVRRHLNDPQIYEPVRR